jgi:HNH endonuclease
MTYIPQALRQLVAERAEFACEYCQTAELIVGGPFHVEHIRPVKLGGLTVADNLAYACARCNLSKAARIYYTAPGDDHYVPLTAAAIMALSFFMECGPDSTHHPHGGSIEPKSSHHC